MKANNFPKSFDILILKMIFKDKLGQYNYSDSVVSANYTYRIFQF